MQQWCRDFGRGSSCFASYLVPHRIVSHATVGHARVLLVGTELGLGLRPKTPIGWIVYTLDRRFRFGTLAIACHSFVHVVYSNYRGARPKVKKKPIPKGDRNEKQISDLGLSTEEIFTCQYRYV